MSDAELTHKERRKARKAERALARENEDQPKKKRSAPEAVEAEAPTEEPAAEPTEPTEPAEPEEEPLSHKERRKRRKMEKMEERIEHSEERDHSSAPPGRPQRSPYSVWIGNLAFSTTQELLTKWLEEHDIQGISRVHMPQGARKFEYNKGFAYVDLPSPEQVEACMALSEQQLSGRRLLIKSGSDYTGRPGLDLAAAAAGASTSGGRTGLTKTAQKVLHAQRNPAAPTLFMGNLSFETTEEAIRELFDGSAQRRYLQDHEDDEEDEKDLDPPGAGIKKIRMGTFEDTGKCKGFAFIDFESIAQATQALIEPRNGRLLGRTLQIEYAGVDAVRRGASRNLLPDYVPTPRRRRRDFAPAAESAPESAVESAEEPTSESTAGSWPKRDHALPSQKEAAPEERSRRDRFKTRGAPRVRPGAANANAARQQYTIVPSQGTRVTFE